LVFPFFFFFLVAVWLLFFVFVLLSCFFFCGGSCVWFCFGCFVFFSFFFFFFLFFFLFLFFFFFFFPVPRFSFRVRVKRMQCFSNIMRVDGFLGLNIFDGHIPEPKFTRDSGPSLLAFIVPSHIVFSPLLGRRPTSGSVAKKYYAVASPPLASSFFRSFFFAGTFSSLLASFLFLVSKSFQDVAPPISTAP